MSKGVQVGEILDSSFRTTLLTQMQNQFDGYVSVARTRSNSFWDPPIVSLGWLTHYVVANEYGLFLIDRNQQLYLELKHGICSAATVPFG